MLYRLLLASVPGETLILGLSSIVAARRDGKNYDKKKYTLCVHTIRGFYVICMLYVYIAQSYKKVRSGARNYIGMAVLVYYVMYPTRFAGVFLALLAGAQ